MNQIRTVTDAKGNTTTCKYDKQGRRIETNNPDTGKITYAYDGAGNLISKTTPNLEAKGSGINYQYDCTRLIAVTYKDQNAVRYTYGRRNSLGAAAGRLIQVSNGDVTDDYQYDWMGNVTKNVRTITTLRTKKTKKYTTMYRYDYLGRMQEMKLPDGERITYGYDRGGQLLGVGSSKNTAYVTKILYNATGQRTSITYANGITTKYSYHPKNHRLETLTTSGEDGTLQEISYEYDDVGNVEERTSSYTGTDGKKKTVTHSYTYDENDRLTKAEGGIEKEAGILRPDIVTYKSSYTYDAIGNILNKTQSVNGQASATLTHNNDYKYTIDKPHAVTKAGNMLYTYDANGNMLTRENTKTKTKMTLVWDNENRLKQSIDTQHTTDYRYDANGERILKSSDMGELEYVSASYVVRNGTIVSKHVFAGNGRVASTVGNLTDEGKTTTNSVLYYHPDHLGSSSYVTDKQGRFYEAIEYLPYGETLYNERTENDGVSYKYTGKEEDAETGLYYYGARYYDAKLCRWISVDPILESYLPSGNKDRDENLPGMGGVVNPVNIDLYHYAGNNPVKYRDPDGNVTIAGVSIGAAWGGATGLICGAIESYSAYKSGATGNDLVNIMVSKTVGGAAGGAVSGGAVEHAIQMAVLSGGTLTPAAVGVAAGGGAAGEAIRVGVTNAMLNESNQEHREELSPSAIVFSSVFNVVGLGVGNKARQLVRAADKALNAPIRNVRQAEATVKAVRSAGYASTDDKVTLNLVGFFKSVAETFVPNKPVEAKK